MRLYPIWTENSLPDIILQSLRICGFAWALAGSLLDSWCVYQPRPSSKNKNVKTMRRGVCRVSTIERWRNFGCSKIITLSTQWQFFPLGQIRVWIMPKYCLAPLDQSPITLCMIDLLWHTVIFRRYTKIWTAKIKVIKTEVVTIFREKPFPHTSIECTKLYFRRGAYRKSQNLQNGLF